MILKINLVQQQTVELYIILSPGMSLCPPPRQSNFQNSLNKALFFLNPVFITILWGYFGVIFKLQGNVFASQRKKKF